MNEQITRESPWKQRMEQEVSRHSHHIHIYIRVTKYSCASIEVDPCEASTDVYADDGDCMIQRG